MTRALDIAVDHLVNVQSFDVIERIEPDDGGPTRSVTLRHWVDAEHALTAEVRTGAGTTVGYGIQRRDLKQLFAELIPEAYAETSPSFQPPAERRVEFWSETEPAEVVTRHLDTWTPQFRNFANLEVITRYYESEAGLTSMIPADGWNRAMNRMLGGWDAAVYPSFDDDETFMDPWGLTTRFEEWIAAHPNGTR